MFYLLFVGVLSNNNILCLCGADECMGYEDMKGSLQSLKSCPLIFWYVLITRSYLTFAYKNHLEDAQFLDNDLQ